jgi:hypothetical protein
MRRRRGEGFSRLRRGRVSGHSSCELWHFGSLLAGEVLWGGGGANCSVGVTILCNQSSDFLRKRCNAKSTEALSHLNAPFRGCPGGIVSRVPAAGCSGADPADAGSAGHRAEY